MGKIERFKGAMIHMSGEESLKDLRDFDMDTYQGKTDFFKELIRRYEPYSLEYYYGLRHNEMPADANRYAATIALDALLKEGFDEDEINPWKNKDNGQE